MNLDEIQPEIVGVKEIARRANVSTATVDRVIHNRKGVSEKTKAYINSIIEELNYQPNVLAQRLALANRGTLHFVILLPEISEETEYWRAPLEGVNKAEAEIKKYGVHIEKYYFDQNDKNSFISKVKQIQKKKIDGLFLTPTFEEESLILMRFLKKKKIPCVLINSDIKGYENLRLSYIGPELFDSGYLSAQLSKYCLRPGQKVLLVNIAKEVDNNFAILRKEEGFKTYFNNHQLGELFLELNATKTNYQDVSEKLRKVLQKHPDIGLIYVTNSRVSLVARWLEENNLQHLILIGYDYLESNLVFLRNGTIDFLICEKPQEQGYLGAMTLFQHLVLSTEVADTYLMPIDIVTKENYKYYRN